MRSVCVRPVLQTGPVVTYSVKLSRGACRVTDERPADLRVGGCSERDRAV